MTSSLWGGGDSGHCDDGVESMVDSKKEIGVARLEGGQSRSRRTKEALAEVCGEVRLKRRG